MFPPSHSGKAGTRSATSASPRRTKELQEFRRWAVAEARISAATAEAANNFLSAYVDSVQAGMANLAQRIDAICSYPGVEVFGLDDRMLERAIALRTQVAMLKPFDEAILAAVLVKAGDLAASGASALFFCDLDGDLVPVDSKGNPRKEVMALYGAAGITVRQDFLVP
jgi:hypothetical protein